MLAEKAAVAVAGRSDRALRVLPFSASILALLVVAWVAWGLLPGGGAVVATALVALAPKAIHFAAVVEQTPPTSP